MNALLDSHALLWWLSDDRRLSRRARSTIADHDRVIYVSAASMWEISITARLGKLADPGNVVPRLAMVLAARGMTELPITAPHAVEAGALPALHRDPFDRMLVAQARLESLVVVTNDRIIRKYGVKTIW